MYGILGVLVRAAEFRSKMAYPSSSKVIEILIPFGVWVVYRLMFGD